jgi:hypothetical protein
MKDILADRLLARVLGWDTARISEERPVLQALSLYKYDDYQQFSPGMRFVESLAQWLQQFPEGSRDTAYRFVRDRLIFCSAAEIRHWVEMAYPDFIRPALLRRVALEKELPASHFPRIAATKDFQVAQRQTLFLGLSDGARIDLFRRSNPELNHEQIFQTHELADERIDELLASLQKDLEVILGKAPEATDVHFRTIVLLDDFSASGQSYYQPKADGKVGGKIAKFHQKLVNQEKPLHRLVDLKNTDLSVLLYAATEQALGHLQSHTESMWRPHVRSLDVAAVQMIPTDVCLKPGSDNPIASLIDSIYDPVVFDRHFELGKTDDAKYGYAACGLPLVLHHNTPNNSLCLLWSYEDTKVRGLFPRIKRHKELP